MGRIYMVGSLTWHRRSITDWTFVAVAIASTMWALIAFPLQIVAWPVLVLLGSMALLAELLPVEIPRRGLRITLTLPFIAGIMHAAGVSAALLADGLITLVACFAVSRMKSEQIDFSRLTLTVALAVISVSSAGMLLWVLNSVLSPKWIATLFDDAVFAVAYAAVNILIATFFGRTWLGSSLTEVAPRSVVGSLMAGLLYMLTSLTVLVLMDHGLFIAIPLMLIPLLMLRKAVIMTNKLDDTYSEAMVTLTLMLQRAHPYTHGHLDRVALLAEKTGLRLGLSPSRACLLRHAAVLHDIGKIAIDEEILEKPARLTEQEMDHVRKHAEYGAIILAQSPQFQEISNWVKHHHERPDGRGYPSRLQSIEIPLESKVIAVTDAFDAMVGGATPGEKRGYRESMTQNEALAELQRCAGTQFDQAVVSAFTKVVSEATT